MATTKGFEGTVDSSAQRRKCMRRSATTLPFLLVLGCSNGGQTGDEFSDGNGVTHEIRGTAARLEATGPVDGTASLDLNDFAWRLLAIESDPDLNTVFSPISISVAMAMLSAGAEGETLSEIQQALGFSTEGEGFHAARNRLLQELEARNREGTEDANKQALRLSDDFWVTDQLCSPADSFLNVLSANYGAGVQLTDFVADPEAARQTINAKVSDDTEALIDELLPADSITVDTRFVLTQAIYFQARWQEAFDASATESAPFETNSGERVSVSMMHAGGIEGSHVDTEAYAAVAIDYEQGELQFVAVMPAPGTFEDFVAGLPATGVDPILEQLESDAIDLRLPKFEIERDVPLKERLQALGVERAFQDNVAELDSICADTYIGDAFHDATIVLDEEGTVAAAATAIVGTDASAIVDPVPITFDRPFVFFIRDVATNAVLFVGQFVVGE